MAEKNIVDFQIVIFMQQRTFQPEDWTKIATEKSVGEYKDS